MSEYIKQQRCIFKVKVDGEEKILYVNNAIAISIGLMIFQQNNVEFDYELYEATEEENKAEYEKALNLLMRR